MSSDLPPGVRIGHWTDAAGLTGCSVVLCDAPATFSGDVRGGSPGILNDASLDSARRVQEADAVLLTGGSAFGLAAAPGVMRWLDEHGRGLQVGQVTVPIILGAVIFDLSVGDPRARPDLASGYAACEAATREPQVGAVGAGTGATVAKLGNPEMRTRGGLGIAAVRTGAVIVSAVMVVNAVGGIWDDDLHEWVAKLPPPLVPLTAGPLGASTTIGCVMTNARLTKAEAQRVAITAHDGLARAVRPTHTDGDGDAIFCLSIGGDARVDIPTVQVQIAAADAVSRAIVAGVRAARSASV